MVMVDGADAIIGVVCGVDLDLCVGAAFVDLGAFFLKSWLSL